MSDSSDIRAGYGPTKHETDVEHGSLTKATGYENVEIRGIETSAETSLHRGLKARHISMLALGGSLGTGLLISSGKALAQGGPGSLVISYVAVGLVVFCVLAALGEMTAYLPLHSGFAGYASRYCHPSLGFALGWTYLLKYIIVTPNQLTAASLVIGFWVPRERVNPGVFVAVFLVAIVCINFAPVRWYGEFEFWLSSFKVLVVIGLILFSLVIASGGGPGATGAPGFRYWRDPGAFAELYAGGALGRFIGFWSVLSTATFAYLGVELCALTAGEAQNPRKSIPKAIRLTFWRILIFYCLSIFLVSLCVPYNSKELAFANKSGSSTASGSPFVVAAKLAGVNTLSHILNACMAKLMNNNNNNNNNSLVFVFSASVSDLYVGARTLYGLSSDRAAPAIFRRVNSWGIPYVALGTCAAFCLLAFMVVGDDARRVFVYFVNLTTIFGLCSWISILVTYLFFLRARRAQAIPDGAMPYRAPQGLAGTAVALAFCVLIALTKSFTVFIAHDGSRFDAREFVTAYLGIPIYLGLIFGHMWWTGSRRVRAADADFFTGKDIIDNEEAAFVERQEERRAAYTGWNKFYDRYISWLF
ncbi:hypothetical protein CDD83_6155 [Cordyceps sp. RAO-2017]|nr:hypothetical protein CDD83_6155 [Cordyceps sp. RAO-2017]